MLPCRFIPDFRIDALCSATSMVNMINEDGSCVSLADARTFAFHQDPYKVPRH